MHYQIKVKGTLDPGWVDWLGGVRIASTQERAGSVVTILSGDMVDQAALFGILDCIRDLNLLLLSVTCEEDGDGEVV